LLGGMCTIGPRFLSGRGVDRQARVVARMGRVGPKVAAAGLTDFYYRGLGTEADL